jgi:DNA mismatch repair protein MSH4
LFNSIYEKLADPLLDLILEKIELSINEDITYQKKALGLRNQRCYAVKSGFNGLLDVARRTYKEATDSYFMLKSMNCLSKPALKFLPASQS